MQPLKFKYFAIVLLVAILATMGGIFGISRCEEVRPPVQANPPNMPLMHELLQVVESGALPSSAGNLQPVLPHAISGIDWQKAMLVKFNAKTSDMGTVFDIDYMATPEKEIHTLTYTSGDEQWHRDWSWERDGILTLISNKHLPVGVTWSANRKEIGKPGRVVTVQPHDKELLVTDVAVEQCPQCAEQLVIAPDGTGEGTIILAPLSGKIIAKGPTLDFAIADTWEQDVAKAGNDVVVGGIEELTEEKGSGVDFVWNTLSPDRQKWATTRKPIDNAYIQSLLPKQFQGMRIFRTEALPRIWPDGSIVFRFLCRKSMEHERISFVGLVKQPQQGLPVLLLWEVYYNYSDEEDRDASHTFDRFYYPVDGGKIDSVYADTPIRNELFFDIDPVHNSILFLRGGRPWRLAINK